MLCSSSNPRGPGPGPAPQDREGLSHTGAVRWLSSPRRREGGEVGEGCMGSCSLLPRSALKDAPLGSPPSPPARLSHLAAGLCQVGKGGFQPQPCTAFPHGMEPSARGKTLVRRPSCLCAGGSRLALRCPCPKHALRECLLDTRCGGKGQEHKSSRERELRTVGANALCAGGSGGAPGSPEERAVDQRRS